MEFTAEEIQLIKLALERYDDNYHDKRMEIGELLPKVADNYWIAVLRETD
jgi:hypothetical protein